MDTTGGSASFSVSESYSVLDTQESTAIHWKVLHENTTTKHWLWVSGQKTFSEKDQIISE